MRLLNCVVLQYEQLHRSQTKYFDGWDDLYTKWCSKLEIYISLTTAHPPLESPPCPNKSSVTSSTSDPTTSTMEYHPSRNRSKKNKENVSFITEWEGLSRQHLPCLQKPPQWDTVPQSMRLRTKRPRIYQSISFAFSRKSLCSPESPPSKAHPAISLQFLQLGILLYFLFLPAEVRESINLSALPSVDIHLQCKTCLRSALPLQLKALLPILSQSLLKVKQSAL